MKFIPVTFARIYVMESEKLLQPIVEHLQKNHIRGVSVFRAVNGYGASGEHLSALVDLSLSLPLAVEFFDAPEKVAQTLEDLNQLVKPEHIVCWAAQANEGS